MRKHPYIALSLWILGCAEPSGALEAAPAEASLFDWRRLEDPVPQAPLLPGETLEPVIALPYPPANVAASEDGRLFFTFMPQGNRGETKVAEVVNGEAVPYPNAAIQEELHTVQSLRVDRRGRLWFLDYGNHSYFLPKIYAVDLATDELVFEYEFPREVGRRGSMFNDFHVAPGGELIFISDSSIIGGNPALVILDLRGPTPRSHRRLEGHPSVARGDYDVYVDGRVVRAYGLRAWFGVDAIALDPDGEWLYFGALDAGEIWRARAAEVADRSLSDRELAGRVELFAETTLTDGITIDHAGHLYLTDMEHDRIVRLHADASMDVLVQDPRLRWPDGFSWGADRMLYVTESALHLYLKYLVVTDGRIEEHAPYFIYRLDPSAACGPGAACYGTVGH